MNSFLRNFFIDNGVFININLELSNAFSILAKLTGSLEIAL